MGVMGVSSVQALPEDVPCPREVWRAAVEGRRISITVQPRNGSAVEFHGEITGRRKVGSHADSYVTVSMVPDGELAPVEIEAGKERGEWGPFRAFNWTYTERSHGPDDHVFQYVGHVESLDIPGGRWDSDGSGDGVSGEGVA